MSRVQLTTETRNFNLGQVTTHTVASTRSLTTTRPATIASGLGSRLVFGSDANYTKLKVLTSANQSLTLYVYGWSSNPRGAFFVPQLLFSTIANGATLSSIQTGLPGVGTVYEVSSYIRNVGDAKIYNSHASTDPGAFIVVDTLGCEFVEVQAVAASGTTTLSVLYSGL